MPAAYALIIGSPLTFATEVVTTTPLPSRSSGSNGIDRVTPAFTNKAST
ncbi:hypothetical protein VA596_33390 [Amycolatopsis sp., V23-08]|uniref:Uncharacterized protein n=1 Tax=Amycolatopsis heterodermiae TaxID=3110235 RepID=A0ABU5RDX0_9PSEU|nr:hypothetical protein [Amycolatopsis sp., V23-08]MEA5364467.1 hypothetical protein [Amycolatopsis sp., V23-08]